MRKYFGFIWLVSIIMSLSYLVLSKELNRKNSEYVYFRLIVEGVIPDSLKMYDTDTDGEELDMEEWDNYVPNSREEIADTDPTIAKLLEISELYEYILTQTILGKTLHQFFEPQEINAYVNGYLEYDIYKKIDDYCENNPVNIAKIASKSSLENILRRGHHKAILVLNDKNEVVDFNGIYDGQELKSNMRLFNCVVNVVEKIKYTITLLPSDTDLLDINDSIPLDAEYAVFEYTPGKNYQYIGFADAQKISLKK